LSPSDSSDDSSGKLVVLQGKNPDLWAKFQGQFEEMLVDLLNTQVPGGETTIREESLLALDEGISSFHSLLKRPSVKNAETCSIITKNLAGAEKARAETRKIHAEAEAIEFQNHQKAVAAKLRKLRVLAVMMEDGSYIELVESLELTLADQQRSPLEDQPATGLLPNSKQSEDGGGTKKH